MSEKKRFLIVTANDYLIYQPTILGIYDFLLPFFDITIISFEPRFVGNKKDESRKAEYIKIPYYIQFVVQNIDSIYFKLINFISRIIPGIKTKYTFFQRIQLIYLKRKLKNYKNKTDHVLAVDIASLVISQSIFNSCDFLSLEIYPNDPFHSKIDFKKIRSVIIQNEVRFEYLFGKTPLNVFFVQNAPVFKNEPLKGKSRQNLIWAGSIVKKFSVLDCIEFVSKYPDFCLVLKGGGEKKTLKLIEDKYQDLLDNKTLIIDQSYLPSDQFISYLSDFKVGICFYSWELINSSFNYQSAPSGKVFMYMAAGVPIVACDIPGFEFITEFKAGVLIKDYNPDTILYAIKEIEYNYGSFQDGCYKAARHFSFDKRIQPYLEFLLN